MNSPQTLPPPFPQEEETAALNKTSLRWDTSNLGKRKKLWLVGAGTGWLMGIGDRFQTSFRRRFQVSAADVHICG